MTEEIDHYVNERRTIKIEEIAVEDGHAVHYRVERGGSRKFNGYHTHFIVHEVTETHYGRTGYKFGTPHERRVYYIWIADDDGTPLDFHEKLDGGHSMDKVAKRFARSQ